MCCLEAGLDPDKKNINPPVGRKVIRSSSTAVGGRNDVDKSSGWKTGDSVQGSDQEFNPLEM